MKRTNVVFMMIVFSLLILPSVASAYQSSVWIEYNAATNPVFGNWQVPDYPSRPSYLGPWDSWADAGKTQALGNLYCIEANVYEPVGGFHEHQYDAYSTSTFVPASGGSNGGLQWAAYLILQVDPHMNTSSQLTRAALQLAVWESLYDYNSAGNGFADVGFSTGSFRINSLTQNGASFNMATLQSTAEGYLSTYKGQFGGGTVLHDGQDLLKVDVPEPGSLALLGAVLMASAGLAWRRRK